MPIPPLTFVPPSEQTAKFEELFKEVCPDEIKQRHVFMCCSNKAQSLFYAAVMADSLRPDEDMPEMLRTLPIRMSEAAWIPDEHRPEVQDTVTLIIAHMHDDDNTTYLDAVSRLCLIMSLKHHPAH